MVGWLDRSCVFSFGPSDESTEFRVALAGLLIPFPGALWGPPWQMGGGFYWPFVKITPTEGYNGGRFCGYLGSCNISSTNESG